MKANKPDKKFNSLDEFNLYKPESVNDDICLLIGMGSCGIAAGAEKVYSEMEEMIKKRGLNNVKLVKVGCLGLCFSEPNVEVIMPGLPNILYGKVTEKFAHRIIDEHVEDGKIINENIYDKPYIDILTL